VISIPHSRLPIYSSGDELRLEYWNNIRDTFYLIFNKASVRNKAKLLKAAKNAAKTKPGCSQFSAADQDHI
jgi:hypothetical protein